VIKAINILIAEPSEVLCRGLESVLIRGGLNCHISFADSLEETVSLLGKQKTDIAIINPSLILNNLRAFNALRLQFSSTGWLGLIYAYYDQALLSLFDDAISITDPPEVLIAVINRIVKKGVSGSHDLIPEALSEREIEVLRLLASGLANKEIADKLNISTNTVISHRKNISQKTGIKSVSGLTIYAVVKKWVSIETLSS